MNQRSSGWPTSEASATSVITSPVAGLITSNTLPLEALTNSLFIKSYNRKRLFKEHFSRGRRTFWYFTSGFRLPTSFGCAAVEAARAVRRSPCWTAWVVINFDNIFAGISCLKKNWISTMRYWLILSARLLTRDVVVRKKRNVDTPYRPIPSFSLYLSSAAVARSFLFCCLCPSLVLSIHRLPSFLSTTCFAPVRLRTAYMLTQVFDTKLP